MSFINACRGVQHSKELDRVIALPRRPLDFANFPNQTDRHKTDHGTMKLWPIQSAALLEIEKMNGGFLPIGVGHGKTLISLLAPSVLGSKCAVILVPPQLRNQLKGNDIPELGKHFKLGTEFVIVAYSELSSSTKADVLDTLKPDLIVADECHSLRHKSSARTKRFMRYMKENPRTRFVALSGTITSRSLKDYAHLIAYALRGASPLPLHYAALEEWAAAIDVSYAPLAPGALKKLYRKESDDVRTAFRSRLVQSFGVVATEEGSIGTSLTIYRRTPIVPKKVIEALERLRKTWCIGEEEIQDALEFSKVARQLASGFYYRWEWPQGKVDEEWLDARKNWHREVRRYLSHSSRAGRDSPGLLSMAAAKGEWEAESWPAWERLRHRPTPPTVAVWLDNFVVKDAVKWASEGPGIIWYTHSALGEEVAAAGGFPLFGSGNEASRILTTLTSKDAPVIVCSAAAHGTGKNLQSWARSIFTTVSAGASMEQWLGRTHRPGQQADEVTADIYAHTSECIAAFESSLRDARYIEDTTGQRQKLNYAAKLGSK